MSVTGVKSPMTYRSSLFWSVTNLLLTSINSFLVRTPEQGRIGLLSLRSSAVHGMVFRHFWVAMSHKLSSPAP